MGTSADSSLALSRLVLYHPIADEPRICSREQPQKWSRGSQVSSCDLSIRRIRPGSSRRVALGIEPPGLPQIRTCRFPASGSSTHEFATRLRSALMDNPRSRERVTAFQAL